MILLKSWNSARENDTAVAPPKGDSLLVSDGGSDVFGFVKRCLVYLWVRHLVHNQYIFRVADEKMGQSEC